MRPRRLEHGDLVATLAALALLVVSFLPWTGGIDEVPTPIGTVDVASLLDDAGIDVTANAWEAFTWIDLVLGATVIVALAGGVARALGWEPKRRRRVGRLIAGLGIASTLLVLYRVIDPPGESSREVGLFLGFVAAAAVAYGGVRVVRNDPGRG